MTGEGRRMLEGFCEYLRRQGKSENTVKAYCQGMKEYMRWHEETFGKRMKLFLRANVLDYISYLRTVKGLSNRSVNAKLASLHSFNLYLIAAGYTKEVVLDKQDDLKVQLKSSEDGFAQSPDSLYFGTKEVTSLGSGIVGGDGQVVIRLKTGTYTIKTLGLNNALKSYGLKSAADFDFYINRTLDTH